MSATSNTGSITGDNKYLIFACLLFLVLCLIIGALVKSSSRSQDTFEIKPSEYEILRDLSELSCRGKDILIDAVKAGPILGKNYNDVLLKLEDEKLKTETMRIRSVITNEPTRCSKEV